jgi:peptide/nickel transport system ATP-binding protein
MAKNKAKQADVNTYVDFYTSELSNAQDEKSKVAVEKKLATVQARLATIEEEYTRLKSRREQADEALNALKAEYADNEEFQKYEEYLDDGIDLARLKYNEMRFLRKDLQIIFQDPYSSLPPRATVGDILSEPVKVHGIVPKEQVKDYVLDLMEKCGLRDYYYERYPHEFSGGQRQRICIARALSVNPKLVVCDEPVSALDVSIQAQIINLLRDLQRKLNLTYLFISHDISVVKFISDKICVMYLGAMVEFGTKKDIFDNPLHPYTQALFSAIPNPNPDVKMNRIVLKGDIPSPVNPPSGCRFHTRCPYANERCSTEVPEFKNYDGHFCACHLVEEEYKNKNEQKED